MAVKEDSLTRASIASFLSGAGTMLIGIVLNILVARALGPSAKGLYAVFLNTQSILIVPSFAIEASLFYVIARDHPSRRSLHRFTWRTAAVQSVLSVGVLAVLVQVPGIRHVLFSGLGNIYLLALLVILAIAFWERYRAAVLPGLQQYTRLGIWTVIATAANSAATAALLLGAWVLHREVTVGALIVAGIVGMAVSAGVWWRATATVSDSAAPSEEGTLHLAREVRSYGRPVLVRCLIEWASYRIDVYLVSALAGTHALGLYSVAIGTGQQLWMIPLALATPLLTRIARTGDSNQSRETALYAFKLAAIASVGLGVVAAVCAPLLLPLVYGTAFQGSVVPLLFVLPGAVVAGATRSFMSYFAGSARNGEIVRAEAASLVVVVALDLWLVPRFGATGGAITASIAYAVSSSIMTYRFVTITGSRWADLILVSPEEVSRLANARSAAVARLSRFRLRWT